MLGLIYCSLSNMRGRACEKTKHPVICQGWSSFVWFEVFAPSFYQLLLLYLPIATVLLADVPWDATCRCVKLAAARGQSHCP